uniref:Uncharacterized protein LOC104226374 n=1 Tax=Nicotiana sylvestris TaxID=4096 RepID=A0A1U7WDC4_NICSY|nr:PREDICTED: uncharacterized protein LOC104226374 [Nicotiana sylvestris]
MECLRTVSYSISINGSPTMPFEAKRGVRQGDPMSPLLFVLAMEYLTRILKQLKEEPNFNYHLRCEKLSIVRLIFADDLLLFCRGDVMSIQLLCECFNSFSKAFGLVANQNKSCMYFGRVSTTVDQEIIQATGFTISELPFRYLGVPLSSKRPSVNQCQPLLDKMLGKVFPLPKKIIQMVEGICKRFLWTGDTNSSKEALVAWEKMCRPKSKGGLNITDLSTWNRKYGGTVSMDRTGTKGTGWNDELQWTTEHMKGKGSKTILYRMCITNVVYRYGWKEIEEFFSRKREAAKLLQDR